MPTKICKASVGNNLKKSQTIKCTYVKVSKHKNPSLFREDIN